jgi:hypothetical protein
MNLEILQWIGYIASIIIALSMMVSSIVKFRWLNMIGALILAIYGFMINAIPVGILDTIIVIVDLYYLGMIYTKKEIFEILEIRAENLYLIRFLEFHNEGVQKQSPGFVYKPDMNTVSFFILRNMSVAGLFLAHREQENVLRVGLDYVIPEYRDFKNGRFVYYRLREKFIRSGYAKVVAEGNSKSYVKYLTKLGFTPDAKGLYSIMLES